MDVVHSIFAFIVCFGQSLFFIYYILLAGKESALHRVCIMGIFVGIVVLVIIVAVVIAAVTGAIGGVIGGEVDDEE